jgi:hypothetical protein
VQCERIIQNDASVRHRTCIGSNFGWLCAFEFATVRASLDINGVAWDADTVVTSDPITCRTAIKLPPYTPGWFLRGVA